MKKILYLLAFSSLLFFSGCDPNDPNPDDNFRNRVLMLKVDYNTLAFESGIEYKYEEETDSFNINVQFVDTSEIATIKLTYKELNKTLFFGTLIWDGMGEILVPEAMDDPEDFESVLTDDVVFPSRGFTNINTFSYTNYSNDYFNLWMSIQNLKKVREFLQLNPTQKVKIFLYAPDYYENSSNWDYYIFIQN